MADINKNWTLYNISKVYKYWQEYLFDWTMVDEYNSLLADVESSKSDMRVSIWNKWVTVPASAELNEYASYIDQIQTWAGFPLEAFTAWIPIRTPRIWFIWRNLYQDQIWACFSYIYGDYLFFSLWWASGGSNYEYINHYAFVIKRWWTDYKMSYINNSWESLSNIYWVNVWIIIDNGTVKLWRSYTASSWSTVWKVVWCEFNLSTDEWTWTWTLASDADLVKNQNQNLLTWQIDVNSYWESAGTLTFRQVIQ